MRIPPPPLARLLEAARGFLEGGPEPDAALLAVAHDFLSEGARLLEQVAPTLPRSQPLTEALHQLQEDRDRQRRALDRLELALAAGHAALIRDRAEILREAALSVQEKTERLAALEAASPTWAPSPELDGTIKVGLNVLEGHLEPSALRPWPARLRRLLEGWEARTEAFSRLLGVEPQAGGPARAGQAALQELRQGLDALGAFLHTGREGALEDSLGWLHRGARELHQALLDQEALLLERSRFSLEPLWELWHRSARSEHHLALAPPLWGALRLELQRLLDQAAGILQDPLGAFLPGEPILALSTARQALITRLEGLDRDPPPADPLASLEASHDSLRRAVDALAPPLAARRQAVAPSPTLARLQLLVAQVLRGDLPDRELAELLPGLESILAEQGHGHEALPHSDLALPDLLERQRRGLALLRSAGQPGWPRAQALLEGWQLLEDSAPALIELSRQLRERLTPAPTPGALCLRCGSSQPPGARTCLGCGARLPAFHRQPDAWIELEAPPLEEATPAHVARLEQRLDETRRGVCHPARLEQEILEQLSRARAVGEACQRRVMPGLLKDPSAAELGRFFMAQRDRYEQGLQLLLGYARTLQDGEVDEAIRECREAGLELLALDEHLRLL